MTANLRKVLQLEMAPLHICLSENRATDEIGAKLLIASLVRHEPGAVIHVFADGLSETFRSWLGGTPNVVQESAALDSGLAWNIKARLLSDLLDKGVGAVTWIDSDVILTAPISPFFSGLPEDMLVVAEEFFTYQNRGAAVRTRGWGLPVGRDLPFTPNSAVLRVTDRHRALLAAWQGLLDRPDYKEMQKTAWAKRPFYMMGDQDALSAVLGSADFADIPVRPLRRGRDIAQCFKAEGYSPVERLTNLRRLPPLIHAQGEKPWRAGKGGATHLQLSPYRYAAAAYEILLDPEERQWLAGRTGVARVLHAASFGHPSLAGLLPAMQKIAAKRLSSLWRKTRGAVSRSRRAPSHRP